jgi:tRNA U38,U39,U40 pseudouridine synthase TruA
MVRRIVHLQVAVGQGKQGMEMIPESLQPHAGTSLVKGLAPPQGLVLVEVLYPAEAIGELPKE